MKELMIKTFEKYSFIKEYLNRMDGTILLYGQKPAGFIDSYLVDILNKNKKKYHCLYDRQEDRILQLRYTTICLCLSNNKLSGISAIPILKKSPYLKTLIVQNKSTYEECCEFAQKKGIAIFGFNRHLAGLFEAEIDVTQTAPFFLVDLAKIPNDDLLWPDWIE